MTPPSDGQDTDFLLFGQRFLGVNTGQDARSPTERSELDQGRKQLFVALHHVFDGEVGAGVGELFGVHAGVQAGVAEEGGRRRGRRRVRSPRLECPCARAGALGRNGNRRGLHRGRA